MRTKMRKKRRLFIFILRTAGIFFGGLVVSLVIALSKVDLETLRKDIASGLQAASGLPVEITGPVSWKFSLRPRATLRDVRVRNAAWAAGENGVEIDEMVVTLDLFSMLKKSPVIQELRLVNARVNLERNEKGDWSVAMKDSGGGRRDDGDANGKFPFDTDFGLEMLELANPRVSITRPDGSEEWSLSSARVKYKRSDERLEYSGHIEKDGDVYSFIAAFSALDQARRVYPVRIAVASKVSPLVINAALEATSKIPIDFVATGTIASLSAAGKLFNLDLPEIPRFDVNVSGGFGHSSLALHKALLKTGGNDLAVSGDFNWKNPVLSATARIKSGNLNLTEVFPELYAPPKTKWVRPKRQLNVFKDTPLVYGFLNDCNCDISLQMGKLVVYRELAIRNLSADIRVRDAKLSMQTSKGIAGGEVRTALRASDDGGILRVRAAGRGRDIMTGEVLKSLRENNFLSGLPMGFDFYLESGGRDLAQLMANLTGPMKFYSTGRGYALADAAEYLYGKDFLTALRHNVSDMVTKEKRDTMRVDCAAASIKLRDGRMETERGVAVETTEVNIRGEGFVDLGRERLQASIITTPVRGLKISITGNVINSMEFTGNMAEPDLKLSRNAIVNKAMAATGVGLLLAPFTGGLSLAAGAGVGLLTSDLLANWLADDNPCRTALEKGAPARNGDPAFLNRPLEELVGEMIGGD